MALFSSKTNKEHFDILQARLENSFGHVKNDIIRLNQLMHSYTQWIEYLHAKMRQQEQLIHALSHSIKNAPKSGQEVKEIVDAHFKLGDVVERIDDLNVRFDNSLESHGPLLEKIEVHHNRITYLEGLQAVKKQGFKEKIAHQITKKSKEYVHGLMLSLIKKYEKVSALQLREIVVTEQGLCSKSSFYRILAEMESTPDIEVVSDGKEKYYLHKSAMSRQRH